MSPILLAKLRNVSEDSILGVAVKNALAKERYDDLEKMLKDCYTDSPYSTNQLLGFDLKKYIE